jgi:hypothetical protein
MRVQDYVYRLAGALGLIGMVACGIDSAELPAGVATGSGNLVVSSIDAELAKSLQQGKVRVIVEFNRHTLKKQVTSSGLLKLLDGIVPAEQKKNATAIPGLAAISVSLDWKGYKSLSAQNLVRRMVRDKIAFLPKETWWTDKFPQTYPPLSKQRSDATGKGQAVVILSSGIDSAHPMFRSNEIVEACFSNNSAELGATSLCPNQLSLQRGLGSAGGCDPDTSDVCLLGTALAGIAAGNGVSIKGVAPQATIIALQIYTQFRGAVCDEGGLESPCFGTLLSDKLNALDYVNTELRRSYNISAVLDADATSRGTNGDCNQGLYSFGYQDMVEDLQASGIAIVAPTGDLGRSYAISAPACHSVVVAVGSASSDGRISQFSNSSDQLDFLSGGEDVSYPVGGTQHYRRWSSTLAAAAKISGTFAAISSAYSDATLLEKLAALRIAGTAIQLDVDRFAEFIDGEYRDELPLGTLVDLDKTLQELAMGKSVILDDQFKSNSYDFPVSRWTQDRFSPPDAPQNYDPNRVPANGYATNHGGSTGMFSRQSYSNGDFWARIKASGYRYAGHGGALAIREQSPGNTRRNGYRFRINEYFKVFSVVKYENGIEHYLGSGHSLAIKRDSFNDIRVVAIGSRFYFYINGERVWTGSDRTFSVGRVGISSLNADVLVSGAILRTL